LPRAVFIIAIVLGSSMSANAEPLAARALAAYERADYGTAARLARRSLAEEPHDAAGVERLYLAYATSLVALGDDEGARGAFATLLAIDPAFRPDADSSPKLLDTFARAGTAPPAPHVEPRYEMQAGAGLVTAEVTASPRLVAVVEVRGLGRRPMRCADGHCTVTVPLDVELRVGLVTPEGALVEPAPPTTLHAAAPAVAVVEAKPVTAAAATPANRPRRKISPHVWIWPTVAVIVAGVAVGLAVGLSSSPPPPELGSVQLTLGSWR